MRAFGAAHLCHCRRAGFLGGRASCPELSKPGHLAECRESQTGYVEDILRPRTVEGVIIGGGSPCQGNSFLNRRRRGLDDARSHHLLN